MNLNTLSKDFTIIIAQAIWHCSHKVDYNKINSFQAIHLEDWIQESYRQDPIFHAWVDSIVSKLIWVMERELKEKQ